MKQVTLTLLFLATPAMAQQAPDSARPQGSPPADGRSRPQGSATTGATTSGAAAQANLSTGVADEERKGATVGLRQIHRRLIDVANTRSGGISLFGGGLEADESRVLLGRAEGGARMQEIDGRLERLEDQNLVTTEMLSRLEDADIAQAVLGFQTLQASLQASIQTTAQLLGITLFDFLR